MSAKQSKQTLKHTYLEMIQVALLTLNERGGSTRQEIWRCIETKFPEANHKSYMLAIRRIIVVGGVVQQGKNRQRFKLEQKFKAKAMKRMALEMPMQKVLSTSATVDKMKKKVKKKKPAPKKPKKQTKKAAGAKGKTKGKSNAKGKGKGASKSAKDKMKDKAKANKKTEGSAKTKAKVDAKKQKGDKKNQAKKMANTNKSKKEKDAA